MTKRNVELQEQPVAREPSLIENAVSLLGYPAADKITGYSGTITSVCFDLYGCLQLALTPKAKKDGEHDVGKWFDVNRLTIDTTKDRVMPVPSFSAVSAAIDGALDAQPSTEPTDYNKGPAAKTMPMRSRPTPR